jgi:lipopolysaccharide assembly outer membrane protein LptD (OstA)
MIVTCPNGTFFYRQILSVCLVVYFMGYGQLPHDTPPIKDSLRSNTDTLSRPGIRHTSDSLSDTALKKSPSAIIRDTVRYEAQIIEYDIPTKMILMKGNGVVHYKSMTLFADTIHFLFAENLLVATGFPQLLEGTDTVIGESMVYNLSTGRGRVKYGTAHSNGSKYDGLQIARSSDKSYYLEEGDYTSCAVIDTPHYCFYGKIIKVTANDKAISRPVILNIGEAPVMALPYFIIPLGSGRSSGWLMPHWGGNPTSGGYLDNIGYYWAPNDYTDFTFAGKISEFASYVLSANANYALRYKFTGNLSGRYSVSTNHDTLNNIWGIDYSHSQNLLPDESMKLQGRGNIVSGKSFYRSVSEDTTELLNQQVNANMSLTKSFSAINAYSAITWNRTDNFKTNVVDQDLPSFTFNLSTRPLIPSKKDINDDITQQASPNTEDTERWYNRISYSYALSSINKSQRTTSAAEQQMNYRHAGLTQNIPISAPQKIFKYFTLTPNINMTHSLFDAYIDTTAIHDTILTIVKVVIDSITINSVTQYIYKDSIVKKPIIRYDTTHYYDKDFHLTHAQVFSWNAGINFSTALYGFYPIKIFSFTGLRHTLTPTIGYSFLPKSFTNTGKSYPGIGIAADQNPKTQQRINFSIGNLFQGRVNARTNKNDPTAKPEERKFTILNVDAGASYDFMAEKRKMSDISVHAGIPNPLINFTYSSIFTPYNISNQIVFPKLLSYNISLTPSISGTSGTFWGGDFLLFEKLHPENYMPGYNLTGENPGWNVNFSPSFSFSKSRSTVNDDFKTTKTYNLNTGASIRFTNIWSVSWSGYYDLTEGKFQNNSLNFTCNLECWDLAFNWNPSGFNQGSFYFIVRIKKHPEIKWERRNGNR